MSHHGDSKESLKEGGLQIGLPKHLEILNANADGGFFGGFFGLRIVRFFFFFFRSCLVEFREGNKMENEGNMDIGHVSRCIR